MGVGSDMFIREIAALVAAFIGIPANTESTSEVSWTVGLPGAGDVPLPLVLPIEELTRRRALKHGRQYTGLPWGWAEGEGGRDSAVVANSFMLAAVGDANVGRRGSVHHMENGLPHLVCQRR